MNNYLTAPRASKNMPKGIPYIIGNELAERFSFYGMKCILIIFMTKYLMDTSGSLSPMNKEDATYWYHIFTSAVYFTPLLGAIIADAFFGKYKTFTGEFRMELTTLWDKYADGDEETALCFTVEPKDSEEEK